MENIYKLPLLMDPQPEGGWTITCPILPRLITEADTLDEISVNVSDAFEAVVEIYEDLNQSIPDALGPMAINAPFMTDIIVHLKAA